MSVRGVLAGSLALIALEAVVNSSESAGRFGGLVESVGDLARSALSPAVAAIPDMSSLRDTTAGAATGGDTGDGSGGGGGSSW